MTKELWKQIPGYKGRYEISNLGILRISGPDRIGRNRLIGQHPGLYATPNGYLQAHLYDERGIKNIGVHQLVMLAFIGPCPSNKQVNHINGRRKDNRLQNLEYLTASENVQHAMANLPRKCQKGTKNAHAKLNESSVAELRRRSSAGELTIDLAKAFGIAHQTASKAINRHTWTHVP